MSDQTPASGQEEDSASRRRFLRHGFSGALFFGLGAFAGTIATRQDSAAATRSRSGIGARGNPDQDFGYDLSGLRRVDPALIHYEETAQFVTGFRMITGLAILPETGLLVAGDKSICRISFDGARVGEIALGASPTCIAGAAEGVIYAGVGDHVEVFGGADPTGRKWPSLGKKAILTSILPARNAVLVADAGNRIIHAFSLDGRKTGEIGRKDSARHVPGFVVPSPFLDLGAAAEDSFWAINPGRHQLERYSFQGDYLEGWGEPGNSIQKFCGCCNPVHFVRLPDGKFVTSEKGLTRIKVYSAQGQFESVVAGPNQFPTLIDHPNATHIGLDVACDAAGKIYVADALAGSIRVFRRKSTAPPA